MDDRSFIHEFFTESDLATVRRATEEAEQHTSGELVSYAVARSHSYGMARARAALFGTLAGGFIATAMLVWPHLGFAYLPWAGEPAVTWLWSSLPLLLGALGGWLLTAWSRALRWFVSDQEMEQAVHARARAAFLEEEIFATRERTGLLIFLALFERRALLLADRGLNEKISNQQWQEIADRLTSGIARDDAAQALLRAIEESEALLVGARVDRRDDDLDELSNEVRIRRD